MAKQRNLNTWLRAAIIGSASAISVGTCGAVFVHRSAMDNPEIKVQDLPGFINYVTWWAAAPAGLVAGAASLAVDKLKHTDRYTLAELESMAIEQGVNPEVAAEIKLLREDAEP